MSKPMQPGDPAYWMLKDEFTTTPVAHRDGCYICKDPEFAQMGLPLCRVCPWCEGHVAADDTICDNCGRDDTCAYCPTPMQCAPCKEPKSAPGASATAPYWQTLYAACLSCGDPTRRRAVTGIPQCVDCAGRDAAPQ